MSEPRVPKRVNTTALFVTGTLCLLFGLFVLSQRLGVAELFLGAHFLFGFPITNTDALKVEAVSVGGVLLLLEGIVILAYGLLYLSRNASLNGASPERTAASTQL